MLEEEIIQGLRETANGLRCEIRRLETAVDEKKAYRLALLNIAATSRKWAVAQCGDTPLAMIAQMAREALKLTADEVDEECRKINWGIGVRGKDSL